LHPRNGRENAFFYFWSYTQFNVKMDPNNDASLEYSTYEEYLDSQITSKELFYLEDEDLARKLAEIGYKNGGDMKREEFDQRKRNAETLKSKQTPTQSSKILSCAGKDVSDSPFLKALAEREELVRSGKLAVIKWLRSLCNLNSV
jgi:hypothetical protein